MDATGALCLKQPWPGMARTIYGDHEHFLDTYYRPFPGRSYICRAITLKVLVTTMDAQWEGMGDVGSAR